MDPQRREYLAIYLNDHLAGATGGVEMARRTRDANRDTEFGQPLATLCAEIEADRDSLEGLMADLDVGRSRYKPALAWLAEKAGRAKLNGALFSYTPLSRVIELETLVLGVNGKLRLWRLLAELLGEECPADLATLASRAKEQICRLEALQERAARLL
jgi:hypothetical protein